jgi:hypothetical protein
MNLDKIKKVQACIGMAYKELSPILSGESLDDTISDGWDRFSREEISQLLILGGMIDDFNKFIEGYK